MSEDKLKIVLDREAETIRRYDAKLEAAEAVRRHIQEQER